MTFGTLPINARPLPASNAQLLNIAVVVTISG
uniref:Uncharacterized protein n=1 Tax=Myoviridae sp. ctfvB24 TaxID=2826679 RepID=A0A8S5M8U9_9CAUD|nr:MAG TPA: hypothetical protein [Myoviridae sp. ctfvB24]